MSEEIKNAQDANAAELTENELNEVAGGAPRWMTPRVQEWCPYCKCMRYVLDRGWTTIPIMTYKVENITVKHYACEVHAGNGVINTDPPKPLYVEDVGGTKYYIDNRKQLVKR